MQKPLALSFVLPVLLLACAGDPLLTGLLPNGDTGICVALGADYQNNVGVFGIVGLPSMRSFVNILPNAVQGDAVIRRYGDRIFVVNRVASNVTVIGPDGSNIGWSVAQQFSTGPHTDPQDVAVVGNKAYVTLYGDTAIQVWDLANPGHAPLARIDLSSYDPDGNPDANSIAVVNGKVAATLDLLDWSSMFPVPRGNGKVVVIDPASDAVDGEIDLAYANPYGFMFPWRDALVVATVADYSGQLGCVHALSMDSLTQRCLAQNTALGGTVSAIAVADDGQAYIAVSAFDAEFNQTAQLRRLDADGNLQEGSLTPEGQLPTDVAWSPTGHLVYADSKVGGLRVYDIAAGREITPAPINIGLSPVFANGIVCMSR
jgi:DNA-binding beta-propeller fold protein YncE